MGNFQKLAPFQAGLPTVQMPAQITTSKSVAPQSLRAGVVNFEWNAPALNPPFPLLIVEVIHRKKTGDDITSASLMAWDRPAAESSNGRVFRGQLKIPSKPDRYFIRIRDPDTLYTQLEIDIRK